jgi:siderophore synthetase component
MPTETLSVRIGEKIYPILTPEHKKLWDQHPEYHILPMHPWEADYLLSQENVQIMEEQGILLHWAIMESTSLLLHR